MKRDRVRATRLIRLIREDDGSAPNLSEQCATSAFSISVATAHRARMGPLMTLIAPLFFIDVRN